MRMAGPWQVRGFKYEKKLEEEKKMKMKKTEKEKANNI